MNGIFTIYCNPKVTNEGFDDDEDGETMGDATHIDLIHMAFLDQVNPPTGDAYTGIGLLSAQIILLSPDNLDQWAYLALGLKGTRPLGRHVIYDPTFHIIEFRSTQSLPDTAMCDYLREFVSYMLARDFRNPHLIYLCDLSPSHLDHLSLISSGLGIRIVNVSSDISGSSPRTGYILSLL